jgi:hypothetical protein
MSLTVEDFNLQNPEQSYLMVQVRWYAYFDACEVCKDLNGQVWETPRLTGIVNHPIHGPVYDLDADISLAHPNCRCFVEFTPIIDFEKTAVFQLSQKILAETKEGMPSNIDEATKQVETLRVETQHTTGALRELEYLFYRTTSTMRRMGLSEEVTEALTKLQRLILTIRILHMTMTFLEMSTPYGWALGLLSGLGAAISASDLALSLGE